MGLSLCHVVQDTVSLTSFSRAVSDQTLTEGSVYMKINKLIVHLQVHHELSLYLATLLRSDEFNINIALMVQSLNVPDVILKISGDGARSRRQYSL